MFITKTFKESDVAYGKLDEWLNSNSDHEYGVKVVQSHWKGDSDIVGGDEELLFITIQVWRRTPLMPLPNSMPRGTIDAIPEEPSIAYPEGEIDLFSGDR